MNIKATAFDRGCKYYDLTYHDKDYDKECDFLESIFIKYSSLPVSNILECGCGTGGHAIPLATRGYQVTAVDASEGMISVAAEKSRSVDLNINFSVQDLRQLKLKKKYDAAISMFAVMGYITTNADLETVLCNIRRSIKPDALFIFDFWNGMAVLRSLPETRTKTINKDGFTLIRTITPELDTLHHLCVRNHHLVVKQGKSIIDEFDEKHLVRFFFPQEIAYYLSHAGFELVEYCPFLRLSEPIDESEWDMTVIARAKE